MTKKYINSMLWSPKTWAKNPPSIVIALSLQVDMEPMEWKEYDDRVVIVFTCGKKIVFFREQLSPTMHEYIQTPPFTMPTVVPTPKPTPAKKQKTPPVGAQHAVPKPSSKSHAGKKK